MTENYKFRLARFTTPEILELRMRSKDGLTLTFGEYILAAGYYYNPNGESYYGAVYKFTTRDHTCEGEIKLVEISPKTYSDNGHAIAWAMSKAK